MSWETLALALAVSAYLAVAVAWDQRTRRVPNWLTFPAMALVGGWQLAHGRFEFLAFCGVLGLGKLLSQGQVEVLEALRLHASDPRWRIREAVAKALQYLGEVDMDALLHEMEAWSEGNMLEQRAAAAALCEPRLLREPGQVESVLQILDRITASLQDAEDRRADEFQALRKGLGYCWSVAVAAYPEAGKQAMERWFAIDDRDVLWIMKQNLRKKRLTRMDAEWVERWKARLGV